MAGLNRELEKEKREYDDLLGKYDVLEGEFVDVKVLVTLFTALNLTIVFNLETLQNLTFCLVHNNLILQILSLFFKFKIHFEFSNVLESF